MVQLLPPSALTPVQMVKVCFGPEQMIALWKLKLEQFLLKLGAGDGFSLWRWFGHEQPCDVSGDLDPAVTQRGRLLSHGFAPVLGKAFQEHEHLIMREVIEWVPALMGRPVRHGQRRTL